MAVLLSLLWADTNPILIESMESKTNDGGAVINRIQYKVEGSKDIWLMEQSHHGPKASKNKWDKIAIVVDQDREPVQAQFYQLENGDEDISMNLKPVNFKVSCFFCHPNGPRAIRPNGLSENVKLSLWDKGRVFLWNMKIKSYGRVIGKGVASKKEFRHSYPKANKVLNVKTCKMCHKNAGFLARGELTKQNFMAIKFMVENKIMPPLGLPLSEEERKEIDQFLKF